MADDRLSWRGGYAGPEGRTRGNSPYGEEDRQRSGHSGGGGGDDRGVFERAGDEVRSWFGNDQFDRNRESGGNWGGGSGGAQSRVQANQGDDWRGGSAGSGRGQYGADQGFGGGGSHPMDDHYRSWRDRHIAELDRDYDEYCRESQQDFHSSFDSWRRNRQSRLQQGDQSHGVPGSSGELATGAAVTARPSDMAGGGATSGTSGSTGSSADMAETGTSRRSKS